MKRRFTFLLLAAMLLMSGLGWAQMRTEVTDVLDRELTGVTGTSYTEWSDKTSNSDAVWAGNSAGGNSSIQLRSSNNNSGIITTTSGGTVTKVVVTWNSNTANGRTLNVYGKNSAYSATTDLYNSQTQGTLIGTIVCGTSTELSITDNYEFIGMRSASGAMYLTEVDVTWENGAAATDPTISAENVNIGYNTENGEIEFTINNPVEGGVLTADTEAEWLTIGEVGNETVPFTCTANETAIARTASVVLTYTYNTDQTVTKNVTITQAGDPNATITIAEARAQGTGAVVTTGVVTSFSTNNSGTTAYMQDETAAIVVFGNISVAVGDEIRVQGTLSNFNGLMEITNPTVTVISQNNTIEPTVMTIEAINADATGSNAYQAMLVSIEDATVTAVGSNNTIAQGTNTIKVYGSLGDAAVNDIITFTGNIGCYNTVQIVNPTDITIQQSEEPAILVDPTTVNVPCAAAEGTLTVTYQNIDMDLGPEIYWYEADGTTAAEYDWVTADFNENGNVDYIIDTNTGDARLAYMKVYGLSTDGDDVYSELITFSQGHYVADFATLPFAFDGGRADIENTDGLTQEGLGSDYGSSPKLKFDGTGDWVILHFNEEPSALTFNLKGNPSNGVWSGTFSLQTSEDGEIYSDVATYTELTSTVLSVEIDNLGSDVRYIKWIYTEKNSGNVALGNITLSKPNTSLAIVLDPDTIDVDAEEHDGLLEVSFINFSPETENCDIQYYDAEGVELEDDPDWILTEIGSDPETGNFAITYVIDANEGEARTAYFKLYAMDNEANLVYSNLVTINQAAYVAPGTGDDYELFTGDLVEGDYVICYHNSTWTAAMKNTVESGRLSYEEVLPNNSVVTTDDATIVWHIAQNGDYWTIYSANANAYAAGTGVKNKAQMLEDGTDDFALWTITGTEAYDFVNKGNAAANVNAYLRNNTTYGFACYAESTGGALSLYKKVVEPETHTLDITGYGDSAGGYYLIASPVASVTPSTENGFLTEAYDLYEFDQSADNEWVNYEQHGFDLVSGKGYLYASQTNTTLTFTGTPYTGNGEIELVYDDEATFKGWNLIGNPFGVTATVDHDYYVINDTGEGEDFIITSKETPVAAMQGLFVVTEGTDDNKAIFTTEEPETPGEKLVLNVSRNRGIVDRAMIRFGEGHQMPKAMLNENHTKLYIPQANNEYAVVRSDNESEMPINFKAAANGTYTISIDADNVEMDYLHLFDNMTGNDVDLLATPSYTFEANTTDYANRFKLVYKNTTSIEENGETFAYFNGENMIITNEGDAQLQVIDMTGRIVSTETINGNATVKVNAAPGVYMLRLVNGNDIKTQKVIIK